MNLQMQHDSLPEPMNPDDAETSSTVLRSTSNPTIRRWLRLRDNRKRRQASVVLVDSLRLIKTAVSAGRMPSELAIEESFSSDPDIQRLLLDLRKRGPGFQPQIHWLGSQAMAKIAYGTTASSVVGLFNWSRTTLPELDLPTDGLILIGDQIEKPGNVGALFRTADAAGAAAVILSGDDSSQRGDPTHPHAIRNSQGTVLTMPTAAATSAETIRALKTRGYRILAARVESSDSIDDIDLRGPLAIVVGNEAEGLRERFHRKDAIAGIRIPMMGRVDSLNVSIGAAVILMEAAQQRRIARNDRHESQNR